MADPRLMTLIQEDRPGEFNQAIEGIHGPIDLTGGQFRGYDLRKFNLSQADLSNAYLRNADIRGLDLSDANLHGASIKDAKLSGTFFPQAISAEEIRLSHEFGNRLRAIYRAPRP